MNERIGFFICHCGINIAHMVDVIEVASFVGGLKGVVVSTDYKFMCSNPGQELIIDSIKKHNLTKVVVASCSPRMHEKTFQKACQSAGINPYFFQMASVREQVSWVTTDRELATRKAKILSAGAINRVRYHQALHEKTVDVHPDIMVVGGGIAGMQASLDIAASGKKVYLVEKTTTIGGHMLQFDKTFPTLDCAACIGTPKMVEIVQHPNVELLTLSEVDSINGSVGSFNVEVFQNSRYVQDNCTGCSECEKVCPVELPNEWDVGLKTRKAVYRAFPQAVPITYTIDKRDTAPCKVSCPAGTNVQGYVQMVKVGNYQQALNIIMERIPLPGTLGRVCPHPCESACRRGEVDAPISIRDLKRFAADHADLDKVPIPDIEPSNKKVAVIGSGPAGLTVSYYLRLKGIGVTLFEKMQKPGGMLRSGIPDYRLPPEILDKEINHILSTGVEIKTNHTLGRDFTLSDLKKEGYSAIFLGIGAHLPISMNIENEDSDGVVDAVIFLNKINFERSKDVGKRVVVIGGGNVAMDAARVALRVGAKEVTIAYRRSEKEMPADHEEIFEAKEEGINFINLVSPQRVIVEQNKVVGIKVIKNELGPPDESGRRRPVPVKNSEFIIECDMVIPAIGQRPETSPILEEIDVALTKWGTFNVNPITMETSVNGVFSAGDAVTGPATVIEAIAAGHKAVTAIERYLNDEMDLFIEEQKQTKVTKEKGFVPIPIDAVKSERIKATFLEPNARKRSFDEVNLNFDEQAAQSEAAKCINCGGCCECKLCVDQCQAKAIDHDMQNEIKKIDVGSVIIATGYDLMDANKIKQFGYGVYPNVYTSLEFERLCNATGPTSGEILIRDENGEFTKKPTSVALIHCVGSRDINFHQYCSRVCCMYALKYSHLIKEKVGHNTKVFDFYIDQRCYGKGYEEFYQRCQDEGTNFIRGKVAKITHQGKETEFKGDMIAIAEDTLLAERIRVPVDMVILCMAMEARQDTQDVARTFGINIGSDGFFLEEHPKLAPLNTPNDGVFLAGTCQGPKDIPDTVAQASGAAAKAMILSDKGKITVPSMISSIDADICVGCQSCIELCPYTAIEFDEFRSVSVVNEALCKGCGNCASHCPSSAAQIRHFNEKQIFAEIDGLLGGITHVIA
ncbi:FAD-dependent oxidoreductase [bacterium]|nr:FAD-dependent oxidoreductase [bacterium]